MIRGTIFDLDGVLLDSMGIWEDLGARYLRRLHITPELGLNEVLFPMSMEQGAAYLKAHYPLQQSEAEICGGIAQMLKDYYAQEVSAKPGAAALLEFLAEWSISMAPVSAISSSAALCLTTTGFYKFISHSKISVAPLCWKVNHFSILWENRPVCYRKRFVWTSARNRQAAVTPVTAPVIREAPSRIGR